MSFLLLLLNLQVHNVSVLRRCFHRTHRGTARNTGRQQKTADPAAELLSVSEYSETQIGIFSGATIGATPKKISLAISEG